MKDQAQVEFIQYGEGGGSIAKTLLKSNFDPEALRSNDTLLYDEWKAIDEAVLPAAQERMVGIADLQSRGLTYNIPNGMSKTVLAYQDAGDIEDAVLSMEGLNQSQRDRPEYGTKYLPLPIIHYDFWFSIREISEARAGRMPLDTTMAEMAARKVAEKAEAMLFQGADSFNYAGGTIYGYEDFTHINSCAITANWDDTGATGTTMLADLRRMKQMSLDDRNGGPWMVYVPGNFETAIDADFKAASDKSIRQRLLEMSGIIDIKVCDYLTDDKIIMVQMASNTVRLVEGMGLTTVQWDTEGGMRINFKVMAIWVPQLRADQNNRTGIVIGAVED